MKVEVDAINRISIIPSLLDVICRTTGMGFAAIARVTEDRWITCSALDHIGFGLKPWDELKVETTICHEIRQSGTEVVIDHVDKDENFIHHHTPSMYGFQSYISVPIFRKDGSFFGTLCAIDPKPAKLNTPEVVGMFKLFADLITFHLNTIEELDTSEAALTEERRIAEVREQFIAILGHDLRNPVATTKASTELLLEMVTEKDARRVVEIIQATNFRMEGLINNILDFAKGRLGGGITLEREPHKETLEKVLYQVISEERALSPDRNIEIHFGLRQAVNCDVDRIAQLFSNLLGNAITHGDKKSSVIIHATSNEEEFMLRVTNHGNKIPDAAMAQLFKPFSRADIKPGKQGLGLGLYIATEIARAHHGTLNVSSSEDETSFTLKIPVTS